MKLDTFELDVGLHGIHFLFEPKKTTCVEMQRIWENNPEMTE